MNDETAGFNDRLGRIETKIDTLFDAMTQLTRMEERMIQHNDSMTQLGGRIDDHEKRIRIIEYSTKQNSLIVLRVERFLWAVLSAGLAALVYVYQLGVTP